MTTKTKRGFTLIELLVVIAIIGILSSVVLASLNTARTRGADANIKANLGTVSVQAQLYYEDDNTYAGLCNSTTVAAAISSAEAQAPSGGEVYCESDADAWAVSAPLRHDSGNFYCIDSTGVATTTATQLTGTAVACIGA